MQSAISFPWQQRFLMTLDGAMLNLAITTRTAWGLLHSSELAQNRPCARALLARVVDKNELAHRCRRSQGVGFQWLLIEVFAKHGVSADLDPFVVRSCQSRRLQVPVSCACDGSKSEPTACEYLFCAWRYSVTNRAQQMVPAKRNTRLVLWKLHSISRRCRCGLEKTIRLGQAYSAFAMHRFIGVG
jgi:hypothetical protein